VWHGHHLDWSPSCCQGTAGQHPPRHTQLQNTQRLGHAGPRWAMQLCFVACTSPHWPGRRVDRVVLHTDPLCISHTPPSRSTRSRRGHVLQTLQEHTPGKTQVKQSGSSQPPRHPYHAAQRLIRQQHPYMQGWVMVLILCDAATWPLHHTQVSTKWLSSPPQTQRSA
jgi:hypothetical protein